MKSVLLKIYPELNLGDDLFLKIILERYKSVQFHLLANRVDYKSFSLKYDNLKIIDRLQNVSLLDRLLLKSIKIFPISIRKIVYKNYLNKQYGEIIDNANLFVTIGGSMFIENPSLDFQRNIEFYKLINNKFIGKDKYYLGCNFGPYTSENFLLSFRKIFKEATDLSFREMSSKEQLNLDHLRVNPDIVFNLEISNKNNLIKNTVGFVLVDPNLKYNKEFDRNKYIKVIRDLIKFYTTKNYKIYFFSFCKKELDEDLINEILDDSSINNSNIEKVFYDGDIDLFLKIYSTIENIYAGRFHSMILSMKFNQRILPIIYSAKMTNILDGVNFKGNVINIDQLNSEDIEKYNQFLIDNKYDIYDLHLRAENNFKLLDKNLN